MNSKSLTCAMCGHSFDPQGQSACPSCPLNKNCQLVCCPSCGYQMVDPQSSLLAKIAERLFKGASV